MIGVGLLDSFGALVSSIVASLVFAILSYVVTVFIVGAGAGLAGYSPSSDFVALAAAILVGAAIVGGASPMAGLGGGT